MTSERASVRSPIQEVERQAKQLLKALRKSDTHAVKRYRKFFGTPSDGKLADTTLSQAVSTICRECGFADRRMAENVFTGSLEPGDDFGELWYEVSTDVVLNHWCPSYPEAQELRQDRGGYLLPYKRQFAVVSGEYLEILGLDPSDPAWESLGFDLAKPADQAAFSKIVLDRLAKKEHDKMSVAQSKSKRKELIREYKERESQPGIYSVTCSATDEVWIDSTPNLETIQNRLWFFLRHGFHQNKKMQEKWKEHGEDTFRYEIVEAFDTDLASYKLEKLYTERKNYWQAELSALSAH